MSISTSTGHDPTPRGLLDAVRGSRRSQMAEQVRELHLVVEWCAAHEVPADEACSYVEFGRDTGLPLAGEGAPYVSEFAVAELAAALGMSTPAGRAYTGRVLEVRYRLPRLWAEVVAGRVPWWKAARVAEHTIGLPEPGAGFVDARVARHLSRIGYAQLERLTEEALTLYAPERAEQARQAALESRRVEIHLGDAGPEGVVEVTGALELADAVDLDTALDQAAAERKALGCPHSHQVRRSLALGQFARHQLTLALNPDHPDTDTDTDTGTGAGTGHEAGATKPVVKPRQAVIHVHTADPAQARCETTRTPISVEQVKGWCAHPDTQVVITPVIDLTDHIHIDRYERPDRLWHQTTQRDLTCAFPHCTRPARGCDCDHVVPYQHGGATCTHNTAPLCRGHHRAKTHDRWTYLVLEPGRYLWRSPHQLWYHRGPTGTHDLGHLAPD